MKILLIHPNIGSVGEKPYNEKSRMEPLHLAVIAALTPPEHEVIMCDDRFEPVPYSLHPNLVAITVEIYTAKRAYQIASEFHKLNIPVILGGIHVSIMPEEASQYADSVFIGDAELLWQQVLEDVKNGKLQKFYYSKPGNFQDIIIPKRDIFQNKQYLPLSLIQFGRGCFHQCNYCAVNQYFGFNHFTRSVEAVVNELKHCNKRIFFFVDDNIIADKPQAIKLFEAITPLKIKWVGQASIDMASDPKLMKAMEKSGCMGHVIGFESIQQNGLAQLNKTPNLTNFSGYEKQINILNDHGLQIWAAFTIGHDSETMDTMSQTLQFCRFHKFAFAAFNILMPYPKTGLYNMLEKEKRLLYHGKWWLDNNYLVNRAAFIPKNLTPDELTQACAMMKRQYNSFSSIASRMGVVLTNFTYMKRMAFLLKYSLMFRKETFVKQNLRLGIKT